MLQLSPSPWVLLPSQLPGLSKAWGLPNNTPPPPPAPPPILELSLSSLLDSSSSHPSWVPLLKGTLCPAYSQKAGSRLPQPLCPCSTFSPILYFRFCLPAPETANRGKTETIWVQEGRHPSVCELGGGKGGPAVVMWVGLACLPTSGPCWADERENHLFLC